MFFERSDAADDVLCIQRRACPIYCLGNLWRRFVNQLSQMCQDRFGEVGRLFDIGIDAWVFVGHKNSCNRNRLSTECGGIITRFSRRMTNFRPDHFSSTAQTFISTSPSGKATSRTVSSVISVGSFAAFLYQETQIAPSCLMSFLNLSSPAANSSRLFVKKWIKSTSGFGSLVIRTPSGSGASSSG